MLGALVSAHETWRRPCCGFVAAMSLTLLLSACGDGSVESGGIGQVEIGEHAGVVTGEPSLGERSGDRWVAIVELTNGEIIGQRVVQVAFDGDDLLCGDDSSLDPQGLREGQTLQFDRGPGEADTTDPLTIAGRRLVADC